MSKSPFLPYACQSISPEDTEAVAHALTGELITRGPLVREFEQKIADYCGAKYAVAFTNGTSALDATYFAAGTNQNDRIVTTPNTFIGSLTGAIHADATPVFIDLDRTTGNLDINLLEFNLNRPSSRGREIFMAVHYAGIPLDMRRIDALIKNPDTIVIEDAAHALGSRYPSGELVGSCAWSHMTVFSFHPNKHITTGEGGMVLTNDEELYQKLLLYRNNGIERNPEKVQFPQNPWWYEIQTVTGNFNFTEFQAALGLSQLKRLDQFIQHRADLVKHYRSQLANVAGITLSDPRWDEFSNYHLFVVQIDFSRFKSTRADLMKKLLEANIGSQVLYIPVYKHPFFVKKAGDLSEYFPQTELFYSQALALPFHCRLTEEDVTRVCESLKKLLSK